MTYPNRSQNRTAGYPNADCLVEAGALCIESFICFWRLTPSCCQHSSSAEIENCFTVINAKPIFIFWQ
ncbi:hypothetical protein, partial [Sutterella wadsworthensis]|uniref:hypothetical protein n=1 Tax=Sutterella wadsworthensis TaxID=40545 RepID=UPI003A92413C